MTVSTFKDLLRHYGHNVVVSYYGEDDEVWNVVIECIDCMEVLMEFDNPEMFDQELL